MALWTWPKRDNTRVRRWLPGYLVTFSIPLSLGVREMAAHAPTWATWSNGQMRS
ncbi:hypothetical protein K439DRAFT_1629633 [Ramaria rubella]|nr:hypothetical protein K439DRAFT_1629633 [Ramaria rubella]